MTTPTITPTVASFAEAVREALADLPADEVDGLTDGLEADLAESHIDRELPDPVPYANELRAAAGLPRPAESNGRGLRGAVRTVGHGLRSTATQARDGLRESPAAAAVLDFASTLRPFWWVLRAWVAYQLVVAFHLIGRSSHSGGPVLPYEIGGWLVLAVLIVLSVQWGRGRWRDVRGMTALIVAGNVAAALGLLPALAATSAWSAPYDDVGLADPMAESSGITLNGDPVRNIYPYGADGKPLTGIQLFTADGRPLAPDRDTVHEVCSPDTCDDLRPRTARLETGESVLNAYPLTFVPTAYDELGQIVETPGATRETPEPPFVKVPKVAPAPRDVAENND